MMVCVGLKGYSNDNLREFRRNQRVYWYVSVMENCQGYFPNLLLFFEIGVFDLTFELITSRALDSIHCRLSLKFIRIMIATLKVSTYFSYMCQDYEEITKEIHLVCWYGALLCNEYWLEK